MLTVCCLYQFIIIRTADLFIYCLLLALEMLLFEEVVDSAYWLVVWLVFWLVVDRVLLLVFHRAVISDLPVVDLV